MTWPLVSGKYGLVGASTTWKYFPSTMQSSSVPLQDTKGTEKAIEWLNGHMTDSSAVLVHDVFHYWTQLYLDKNHVAIFFTSSLTAASSLALENGFDPVYFVWWNERISWFSLGVPRGFSVVFSSGRISVFEYV